MKTLLPVTVYTSRIFKEETDKKTYTYTRTIHNTYTEKIHENKTLENLHTQNTRVHKPQLTHKLSSLRLLLIFFFRRRYYSKNIHST